MRTAYTIYFCLVLAIAIGMVKNIIKLTDCDFEPSYKAEIIHIIGLIPPIGAITGWLDVGK
jgi:hypothetical protein